jgi:hypothetical protein
MPARCVDAVKVPFSCSMTPMKPVAAAPDLTSVRPSPAASSSTCAAVSGWYTPKRPAASSSSAVSSMNSSACCRWESVASSAYSSMKNLFKSASRRRLTTESLSCTCASRAICITAEKANWSCAILCTSTPVLSAILRIAGFCSSRIHAADRCDRCDRASLHVRRRWTRSRRCCSLCCRCVSCLRRRLAGAGACSSFPVMPRAKRCSLLRRMVSRRSRS